MILDINDVKCEYDESGTAVITVLKGDDVGIKFKYGKVWFEDEYAEEPVMQFQYDIISGTPIDKPAFEHGIAHLLQKLILNSLESGTISYTGGTDIPQKKPVAEHTESTFQYRQAGDLGRSKPGESAMSFLDRLATQGLAEMKRQ